MATFREHIFTPRTAEVVSAATFYSPLARRLIMGLDTTPTHYHRSATKPSSVPKNSWAEYPGVADGFGLPWPRWFGKVAVTGVNIPVLNQERWDLKDEEPIAPALAYQFDADTLLVTLIGKVGSGYWPGVPEFGSLLDTGYLRTTAGWANPETRALYVPPNAVTAGEVFKRSDVAGAVAIY